MRVWGSLANRLYEAPSEATGILHGAPFLAIPNRFAGKWSPHMSYVKSFFSPAPSTLFTALSFTRLEPGARACSAIGEEVANIVERHAVVVSAGAEGDVVPGEAERERGCSLATCDQVFFSRLVTADDVVASTSNPVSSLLSCFSSDGAPEKDQPCFGVEPCDNGEDGVEFPLWLLETSNFPASPAPPNFPLPSFPFVSSNPDSEIFTSLRSFS